MAARRPRSGPHDVLNPYAGRDVGWLLDLQASRRSAHPFLIWAPFDAPSQTWTYQEFAADSARVAAGLRRRGVQKGDAVLIHLDNCPELMLTWFACARLGALAVTTNARSSPEELGYFAEDCDAVGVVTQPRLVPAASSASGARWMVVTESDNGAAPTVEGFGEPFRALHADATDLPSRQREVNLPLCVQYTSGTTARPKGVVWTHANALWGGQVSATHEALLPGDRHLTFLPLFHTNSLCFSMLATMWAGATMVLQPRFSASRFWPTSLEHKCTWSSLALFCLRVLETQPAPREHTFRYWGAAVCDPSMAQRNGIRTIGWWGMTETVSHPIVGDPHHPNVPLSCGRPAPEYQVRIVDDDGRPVQAGETGDLEVYGRRGLSLFAEYLNAPEATRQSFTDDGFLVTGDRVTLLDDGHVRFADRAKDMLRVGGENVAASEIERVVAAVPGVAEVAVVSAPHTMLDEVPVAFVIPHARDDITDERLAHEVIDACRRRLADFKTPSEVFIEDELPRSTLGKVAKAVLRERLRVRPATDARRTAKETS